MNLFKKKKPFLMVSKGLIFQFDWGVMFERRVTSVCAIKSIMYCHGSPAPSAGQRTFFFNQ